jgi:hypothetical protein
VADDTRNEVGGRTEDVVYLADARVRRCLKTLGEIIESLDEAERLGEGEAIRQYKLWLHAELLCLDEARLEAVKRPAPDSVPAGGA